MVIIFLFFLAGCYDDQYFETKNFIENNNYEQESVEFYSQTAYEDGYVNGVDFVIYQNTDCNISYETFAFERDKYNPNKSTGFEYVKGF